MLGYYTVVYRVDGDNAAHDGWWQALRPLFMTDSEPVSITAISKADETTRIDCIRHIVEGHASASEKVEAIEAILIHPDPGAWWYENAEQREAREEYPDHGPLDPHQTSGPQTP